MKTYVTTSNNEISFELSNNNGHRYKLGVNLTPLKTELINTITQILRSTIEYNQEKLLKLENRNYNPQEVYNTLNISIPLTEEIVQEIAYSSEEIIGGFIEDFKENLSEFLEDNQIYIPMEKENKITQLLNQIKETLI